MKRAPHIPYSAEELAFIQDKLVLPQREAHALFCAAFNRTDVSYANYRGLCKRKKWKAGRAWTKPGYVSPLIDRNWTAQELAWVEANRTMPRSEAVALFNATFGKSVKLGAYHSLCKRKGWLTGRDGRIRPGNVPANKGKKMPFNANSARTQFKKGQRPHNTKQLGHEWLHPNGYVYIIVDERNPHTGFEHRSVLKHIHLWEKQHGPVPEGMCLKCKDGDKTNCDPSNWELISRGVLPILSGRWDGLKYDAAPEEVKPAIMARAKLRHAASQKRSTTAPGPADPRGRHEEGN